jgi:hypothetical protein
MPTKMYNIPKIVAELKALTKLDFDFVKNAEGKRELTEIQVAPTVFVQDDAVVCVSAEDGRGWADYYGEFSGGYPTIHEKLEQFAKVRGLNWQWQNGGVIALYN